MTALWKTWKESSERKCSVCILPVLPFQDFNDCSVTKSCPIFCNPMDCSMLGFTVLHYIPEFAKIHIIVLVMLSNHLILCHLLMLLPSVFPSFRVFSNESALHIRKPKYCSFSFIISLSNEYSGLISFSIHT